MLQDAVAAFGRSFSPAYRRVLIRSVLIALGLLAVLGIGAHWAMTYFVTLQWGWAELTLDILAAVGIFIGAIFLVPPVTSLVAGLFLDEVAERVETEDFPADPPGQALPFVRSLAMTLKFFGVMLVVNLIALALLLVPGVNLVVFYIANGYLLGREYFQLAAMRFRGEEEAAELRRRYGISIFLGGLVIAVMVSIPILNLATPVFATIFMVRLHKRLTRRGTP
ncbi:CysZ protein [Ancylobacter sp. 3268]|uniref:sulfate transporter family protein n=1 Tax=Ancylobacter sp. 3268 TaxID=2817752 RepID=UPI00285D16DE|nr:sulfate transporter family protein [Ancylobacter sp. 3268]MDR6955258.1 CysZ protein [Ancylobacter sp. 3268]